MASLQLWPAQSPTGAWTITEAFSLSRRGRIAVAACSGLAIGLLLALSQRLSSPVLITSFSSSCAAVFGAPTARMSRPQAIMVAHVVSALSGLALALALPAGPVAYAAAAGLSMAAMLLLDRLHPPAIANALLAFQVRDDGAAFILAIMAGATIIACIAGVVRAGSVAARDGGKRDPTRGTRRFATVLAERCRAAARLARKRGV